MLGPRSSRFYQAALQSGLIDEAGLNACWEAISPERRTPEAIDRRLARQAISMGRITLWQAQQLLANRVTGFQIDKYLLLDLLGRGGMGRVFLARDVRLNRMVALKLLSQERMNNPRAIARFRREAKVGAQLQHEHLVRVYDEGESAGVLYLVMEHIDGKNVGQLIGDLEKIPWPTAARLARQVALGLEHARLKGLIHRDVNPCNILVTQDGTAKLTDLGLAIDLNDLDNVTREGATVGTFDYVSPEQAKNSRSVDTRADLYSLGCTLFHMISGRVPFPMSSLPEKLYAHQLHDPEPLTELVPDLPEGLAEVVRRLMRKLPDDRFQTPAEVAFALEPFATETGWTATPGLLKGGVGNPARSGSGEVPVVVGESSLNLTPIPPGSAREPFFPLDLGPVGPLAGNLHKTPRSRPSSPGFEEDKPPKKVKVGLIAVVGFSALILASVIATLTYPGAAKTDGNVVTNRSGAGRTASNQPGNGRGNSASSGSPTNSIPITPPNGDVSVRFRDGSSEAAPDLNAAIARAVRDRGEVILAAGSTVRLTNEPTIRVSDGGVTIRGASGPAPTIEIAMKGPQPAFRVASNLKLLDLVVNVRYDGPSEVPVWQVERDLTCERCVFRASGAAKSPGEATEPPASIGSRLFLAEGPKLTVLGCLFAGFDRPIEFTAGPGASATLDHSMFIAGGPSDDAPLVGQAIMVRSVFGGGSGVRLRVQNCSARSKVFLCADQFSMTSPLTVEVAESAIWANAVLELENMKDSGAAEGSPSGEKPTWDALVQAVGWRGRSNRFRIVPDGSPWAQLSTPEPLANAPTTLDAWSSGGRESNGQIGVVRFVHSPTTGSLQPDDYAFSGEDAKPMGADPGQVGPRPGR